jgi:hypothetical protein
LNAGNIINPDDEARFCGNDTGRSREEPVERADTDGPARISGWIRWRKYLSEKGKPDFKENSDS